MLSAVPLINEKMPYSKTTWRECSCRRSPENFFDWSWEFGIERRGRQTGCLKKFPLDQMLMLELCYNIFHVGSATLSILKVKGYSLHDYSNVFLLWNFCIHPIALNSPADQKFHLFTCRLSILF